jgi:hypothetical protein
MLQANSTQQLLGSDFPGYYGEPNMDGILFTGLGFPVPKGTVPDSSLEETPADERPFLAADRARRIQPPDPRRFGSGLEEQVRSIAGTTNLNFLQAHNRETTLPNTPHTTQTRSPGLTHLRRSAVLADNARLALGDNGIDRLREFERYEPGWDAGRGNPMSIMSLSSLEWFLNQLPELANPEPSLFLARSGNLQLGFEDVNGHAVEIEFFPTKIEYYFENSDDEGSVDLTNISEFISRLRSLLS